VAALVTSNRGRDDDLEVAGLSDWFDIIECVVLHDQSVQTR
jgi:hypothetical protein